ncbi:MAG TPA: lysophospholipid acyltransferase family protein [Actinomycetota bacterium]|nr:lysophospholipid acyltransferase family protein [Actinomycetota bacterium]
MGTRDERSVLFRVSAALVGIAFRLCFRLRYAGTSHVPSHGRGIVAGNHVSALDGVVLGLAVSERRKRVTRFLVAAEFFDHRWFSWALRSFRQIPVHRGTRDVAALQTAIETVEGGALAGIFPEGKVNPGTELQPAKKGVAKIALATGAAVIPVGIWGTQDRWPRSGLHRRRPWRPVLAVTFGEPIEPRGDPGSAEDVDRFLQRVMDGVADQVEVARALAASR